MGTDRLDQFTSGTARGRIPSMNLAVSQAGQRSSGPTSFGFSSLEPQSLGKSLVGDENFAPVETRSQHTNTSLHNELENKVRGMGMLKPPVDVENSRQSAL